MTDKQSWHAEAVPRDLHAEIMNLRIDPNFHEGLNELAQVVAYKMGHRDARHAAAELASAHLASMAAPGEPVATVYVGRDKLEICWHQQMRDGEQKLYAGAAPGADAKDAARWAWLRARVVILDQSNEALMVITAVRDGVTDNGFLDEAVDTAMAKEQA